MPPPRQHSRTSSSRSAQSAWQPKLGAQSHVSHRGYAEPPRSSAASVASVDSELSALTQQSLNLDAQSLAPSEASAWIRNVATPTPSEFGGESVTLEGNMQHALAQGIIQQANIGRVMQQMQPHVPAPTRDVCHA